MVGVLHEAGVDLHLAASTGNNDGMGGARGSHAGSLGSADQRTDARAQQPDTGDRFHERSVHEGFEQDDRAAEGHGNDG
jgi:hypothetical protein